MQVSGSLALKGSIFETNEKTNVKQKTLGWNLGQFALLFELDGENPIVRRA